MRTIITAIAICAVSFVADVAGDLAVGTHPAIDSAQASARVDLPPYLAGAERAHPLPARHVAHHRSRAHAATMMAHAVKPHRVAAKLQLKPRPQSKFPASKY
ncbi:MAG: hypothetical protein ABUL73_01290 [Alphaproteobacteria bacterium]